MTISEYWECAYFVKNLPRFKYSIYIWWPSDEVAIELRDTHTGRTYRIWTIEEFRALMERLRIIKPKTSTS